MDNTQQAETFNIPLQLAISTAPVFSPATVNEGSIVYNDINLTSPDVLDSITSVSGIHYTGGSFVIFDITSGSTEEFVLGDGGIVDFTISGPGAGQVSYNGRGLTSTQLPVTISDSFFTLSQIIAQMVSSTDNFSAVITDKHNGVSYHQILLVTLSTTESIHYNSDDPIGGNPLFTSAVLFQPNNSLDSSLDTLTYSADPNHPLPQGLTVDPTSGIISGTPSDGIVGSYLVDIIATNADPANAGDAPVTSGLFTINVAEGLTAKNIPITLTTSEGTPYDSSQLSTPFFAAALFNSGDPIDNYTASRLSLWVDHHFFNRCYLWYPPEFKRTRGRGNLPRYH